MTTPLDYALAYATRLGWPVFPCHHPVERGDGTMRCSCGSEACTSPAKHPRTRRGVGDATTSADIIRDWWTRWSDANVAIACGDRLAVVDIDPRHDPKRRPLDVLMADLGPLSADAPRVATGGNGMHVYFAGPHRTVGSIGGREWAELRARGAYVLAPPSIHISGRQYTHLVMPSSRMSALPTRFRDQAGERRARPVGEYAAMAATDLPEGGGTHGGRHNTAASLIGYLLRRIDPEVAWPLVSAWNQARCKPPLPPGEISRLFRDIFMRETRRQGAGR